MSSNFTVCHPSTCKGAVNVNNEKLGCILPTRSWTVYVLLNLSVQDEYCHFRGSECKEGTICIYVATPLATSSSRNMSHPSKSCWIENTKVILYITNHLKLKKYELNNIDNVNNTLQHVLSWFSSWKQSLLMVVCYLKAPKKKTSSGTWLAHPSSSAPPIEAESFWKNRTYISTLPGKLWVAVTQDLKKKNENNHNWNILVKCRFYRRILIWKKYMWILFWQAKHTQNTENIPAIITDPECTIFKKFYS